MYQTRLMVRDQSKPVQVPKSFDTERDGIFKPLPNHVAIAIVTGTVGKAVTNVDCEIRNIGRLWDILPRSAD